MAVVRGGGRCDCSLPLRSQFRVGPISGVWLDGEPDGGVSIPILTRLPTVGVAALTAYLGALYMLQAPRLSERVLERKQEKGELQKDV